MTVQDQIRVAAVRYGVDPALALAVAQQESGFRQSARGAAGEVGVYQLLPGTAGDLRVDPYNEAQNIDGGVRYLSQQLARFGDDPALALAAYNCGPSCAASGSIPSSTQRYVDSVLANVFMFASSAVPANGVPFTWPPLDEGYSAPPGDGLAPPGGELGEAETTVLLVAAALAVALLA